MLPKSYRLRIPLSLIAASIVTVTCFSALLLVQTYKNIQEDQRRLGERLVHVLSPPLATALRHEDVWAAYSLLRGPGIPGMEPKGWFLVLLDDDNRIFASDQPATFRVGDTLPGRPSGALPALRADGRHAAPRIVRVDDRTVMTSGLTNDNVHIGTFLVGFPNDAFWKRFLEIATGGFLAVVGVFTVLIPAGWVWGNRIVAPLRQLERSMSLVGRETPDKVSHPRYAGEDEISRLGQSFNQMLSELAKKQELEKQVVAQERLAAIGRLTAGVAHEINNPLAGVMVALDTLKKTSVPTDAGSQRTIDLIERGLRQIRDTVSALLVECRVEPRDLTPDDIDDIRVLLNADESSRSRSIEWRSSVTGPIPIPATAVRQVILNLGLNAAQSAWTGSTVKVLISARDEQLLIDVGDDGPPIPEDIEEHLFEPFESRRPGGTGLGLWVTYETIRQLGGTISVSSRPGWTEFRARIPFHEVVAETTGVRVA